MDNTGLPEPTFESQPNSKSGLFELYNKYKSQEKIIGYYDEGKLEPKYSTPKFESKIDQDLYDKLEAIYGSYTDKDEANKLVSYLNDYYNDLDTKDLAYIHGKYGNDSYYSSLSTGEQRLVNEAQRDIRDYWGTKNGYELNRRGHFDYDKTFFTGEYERTNGSSFTDKHSEIKQDISSITSEASEEAVKETVNVNNSSDVINLTDKTSQVYFDYHKKLKDEALEYLNTNGVDETFVQKIRDLTVDDVRIARSNGLLKSINFGKYTDETDINQVRQALIDYNEYDYSSPTPTQSLVQKRLNRTFEKYKNETDKSRYRDYLPVGEDSEWMSRYREKRKNLTGNDSGDMITFYNGTSKTRAEHFIKYGSGGTELERPAIINNGNEITNEGLQIMLDDSRASGYAEMQASKTSDIPVVIKGQIEAKYVHFAPNGYEFSIPKQYYDKIQNVEIDDGGGFVPFEQIEQENNISQIENISDMPEGISPEDVKVSEETTHKLSSSIEDNELNVKNDGSYEIKPIEPSKTEELLNPKPGTDIVPIDTSTAETVAEAAEETVENAAKESTELTQRQIGETATRAIEKSAKSGPSWLKIGLIAAGVIGGAKILGSSSNKKNKSDNIKTTGNGEISSRMTESYRQQSQQSYLKTHYIDSGEQELARSISRYRYGRTG